MNDPEELDAYVEALMEGRIDPDGAEAGALFARDPKIREAFEATRILLAQLDAGLAFERSTLEEASALEKTPDVELVHRTIQAAALRPRSTGAARSNRHLWIPALAACLLAILVLWTRLTPQERPDMTMGSRLELLNPVGPVEAYATFEWKAKLPRAGTYEIVVFDAVQQGNVELARRASLEVSHWNPEPDEAAAWPDRIRWRVDVIDGAGDPVARESAQAKRAKP